MVFHLTAKFLFCYNKAMMRLDSENPILYCAKGTNLPPMKVTESFLSTQPQFNQLSSFITFLTVCCQQGIQPISSHQESLQDEIDLQLNPSKLGASHFCSE